jgi:transcriptional regulator with GAF, ATPase, and Fis domain
VRELSTVIERAVILGRGRGLDLAAALGVLPSEETDPDPGSLAGLVRRAIETALLQARGRIEGPEGAARALGLHPATLRSRIRRLGIDPAGFRSGPHPRTTAETTRVSRSAR